MVMLTLVTLMVVLLLNLKVNLANYDSAAVMLLMMVLMRCSLCRSRGQILKEMVKNQFMMSRFVLTLFVIDFFVSWK